MVRLTCIHSTTLLWPERLSIPSLAASWSLPSSLDFRAIHWQMGVSKTSTESIHWNQGSKGSIRIFPCHGWQRLFHASPSQLTSASVLFLSSKAGIPCPLSPCLLCSFLVLCKHYFRIIHLFISKTSPLPLLPLKGI